MNENERQMNANERGLRLRFLSVCIVILTILFPVILKADGLRYYISDDTESLNEMHIGDPSPDSIVSESEEIYDNDELWFGPSLGLDIVILDMETREYTIGIVPGLGYGLKWKPDWYDITSCFLAIDLFFQASFIDTDEDGFDYFTIDLLPIITFIDWVSIGIGPRFNIGLSDNKDSISWIISFGIKTSV